MIGLVEPLPQPSETLETMKNWQLLRNFSSPVYGLCLATLAVACSGSEAPAPSADGGSGGSASGSGGSQSGGGGSVSGSGGGSSGSGPSGSTELVGSFQVQVVAPEGDVAGSTTVLGKVNDGPSPGTIKWTVGKQEGDCKLEIPAAPFCDGGCGAGACVDDGKCQAYPVGKTVGEVTLKGVNLSEGGSDLVLREIAKAYQPPAGTTFAYPSFAEGDAITVTAAGGDYAGFELKTTGIAPVTFTSTDFEVDVDKALELKWSPAAAPTASKVTIKLDISHHGGTRGQITCETNDSGAVTISAALMTELIGLGVAGFPSVILTRSAIGSAQIEAGRVQLVVSSKVERFVDVVGVESCNGDEDCSEGKTCQGDLTCQ